MACARVGASHYIVRCRSPWCLIMYRRFGQIYWGLLLVILDFKVNDIDLLPDFIGYILVATGARGLLEVSDRFRIVRNLSWCLAIISVANSLLFGDRSLVWELVAAALDCAMMWFLLGGVIDISSARDRLDLAEQASHRRIAYLTLMCIVTIVSLLAGGRGVGNLMAALAAVNMLVIVVMILRLIYRVRHEIAISDA
jgi:hypothetical protein